MRLLARYLNTSSELNTFIRELVLSGYRPSDLIVVYTPRGNGFGGRLDGWTVYYEE